MSRRPPLRKVSGHRDLAVETQRHATTDLVLANIDSEAAQPSSPPYMSNALGLPFSSVPRLVVYLVQAYERNDEETFCAVANFFASHVVNIAHLISLGGNINPEKEDLQFARSSFDAQLETFNMAVKILRSSSSKGNNEMYMAKEYANMVRSSLHVLFNVAKPLPSTPTNYRERREGVLPDISYDRVQIDPVNKDLKRKGDEIHEQYDQVGLKRIRREPPRSPTPVLPALEGPRSEEIYNQRRTALLFGKAKFSSSAERLAEGTEGMKLGKDNSIQAISLPSLIRVLTSRDGLHEPGLSQIFLGTFRLFITPDEFLEELTKRFNTQPPSSLSQDWRVKISNIHVRVLAIIYSWLDQHWQPDQDAAVLGEIRKFVEMRSEKDIPRGVVGRLLNTIEEREMCSERELIEKQRWDIAQTSAQKTPPPEQTNFIFPLEFPKPTARGLLCIDTPDGREELARHLTLKMSNLFHGLNPSKVVQFWYQKGESSREYHKFKKEPGVKELAAVSSYGESLTHWVIASIVEVSEFELRVRRLSFWIDVASRCMEYLDYATAHNIYVSLISSPVRRLKRTILMVPRTCKGRFKKLADFFDDRGYTLFRQTFDHLLPSIPPTTPLLRDIIQVKARVGEACTNSSRIAEGQKLVFIDECKVIHQAKRVLNKALMEYKFQRDKSFARWLNEFIKEFDEPPNDRNKTYDRLYQISIKLEAKEAGLPNLNPWEYCTSTPDDPLKGRTKYFDLSAIGPSLEQNTAWSPFTSFKVPNKPRRLYTKFMSSS